MATEAATIEPTIELPDGEYAIVECLGHQTLVGRCSEIERFGTKLLAIEPVWEGQLLPVTYRGGASIYAFTPCTKEVALAKCAKNKWDLPRASLITMPPALIAAQEQKEADEQAEREARWARDDDDDGVAF